MMITYTVTLIEFDKAMEKHQKTLKNIMDTNEVTS